MKEFSKFSDEVNAAIHAAESGLRAALESRSIKKDEGRIKKGDANLAHHAIVTAADRDAQKAIFKKLHAQFPNAFFIMEEKIDKYNAKVITNESLSQILENGSLTFGIDPLDGTSQFKNKLYEWSISVGVMKNGKHTGGAIISRGVLNGITVIGEKTKGVYCIEESDLVTFEKKISEIRVSNREPKNSMVYIGVDPFFMPAYNRFKNKAGKVCRTMNSVGSCALGLALVAAGRVDALVQPVQSCWDWFAGYPLVEEAGGKFLFYHYRNGKPVIMEKPDIASYDLVERNTAFIAGNPKLVNLLWELLEKNWIVEEDQKFIESFLKLNQRQKEVIQLLIKRFLYL